MNKKINIKKLFSALDEEMKLKLSSKIDQIYHPTAKGNETELNWIGLLRTYLPTRYKVDSGFIVDHGGNISEQIDIVVYDRHFTPFIFRGENVIYIPAEGVYAVFEAKPNFDQNNYDYAIKKLKSVKDLKRTSASFSHILGEDKKKLFNIVGGLLTKVNTGKKSFGNIQPGSDLAFVMCLDCGIKVVGEKTIELQDKEPILAFFLLKLIERLRTMGSVPALEVDKYLSFITNKKYH